MLKLAAWETPQAGREYHHNSGGNMEPESSTGNEDRPKHEPLKYLQVLLPLLTRMLQAQGGQPIPAGEAWKDNRQYLAKKFLYHLRTLVRIADGDTIDLTQGAHRFVDHGSINVIARALLENFIVFEWVFGPAEESLSYFRQLTWRAAGLKDRTDAPSFTDEAKQVQAHERVRFAELCNEIKANKHFKEVSPGAQKALTLGKWRMGRSIEEIAAQVGFHSRTFGALYMHLCAYSHSSYISALQTGQASEEVEKQLSQMSLGVACNMTARMIETYGRLFPIAQAVLDSASEYEKLLASRWNLQRENFEGTYGTDTATSPRAWKNGRPVAGTSQ
jgi:hypothetical protein